MHPGAHSIELGPAVDEAAEFFEKANGPFLWLASSALDITRRYADTFADRLEPTILLPYSVPLNDGRTFESHVFAFFNVRKNAKERETTRNMVLRAFGAEPLSSSAKAKKENAVKFLDYVERYAASGDWKFWRPMRFPAWEDLSYGQRLSLLARGFSPTPPPKQSADDARRVPRRRFVATQRRSRR